MTLSLILLAVAIFLNIRESKALLLTLLIFLTKILPVSYYFHTRVPWISVCIGAELFVLLSAIALNTKAKFAVVFICTMLIISHINAILFSGDDTSYVYTVVEPFLEYAELAVCSLFSLPVLHKLKELLACHLSKS